MGGLSKKASQFNRLAKLKKLPTLKVDGGSLLFKSDFLAGDQRDQAEITAETIVEAYNLIGYDAVGVGGRDLAAGLDFLLKLKNKSQFAWLSANLIDKGTGKPHFEPSISRQLGDLRVAVAGLTAPIRRDADLSGKNTAIRPWREILPGLIEGLTDNHDFIILLTDLGGGDCREIAGMYPAVNLIIRAGTSDTGKPPVNLSDSSIMTETGKKGKYIGAMEVAWRPGTKWQSTGHQDLLARLAQKNRLQRQMAQVQDRPELKAHFENYRRNLAALEKTIAELEKVERAEADKLSAYDNRFVAMTASLPDHPAIRKLVEEGKRSVNENNRKSLPPPVAGKGMPNRGFTGWTTCRNCHREQVDTWQASRHAGAYLTLVEKSQQFNLECLPCHVTGADPEDPASMIGIPAGLQAVGCESCHGPGTQHKTDPAGHRPVPVKEKVCLACHTPEQDDTFNFATGLNRLKCGKPG